MYRVDVILDAPVLAVLSAEISYVNMYEYY